MMQSDIFHYPPELFELLVETLPILNRSKKSVILFFRGAGVSEDIYKDISDRLEHDRESVCKFRIILTPLFRFKFTPSFRSMFTPPFLKMHFPLYTGILSRTRGRIPDDIDPWE